MYRWCGVCEWKLRGVSSAGVGYSPHEFSWRGLCQCDNKKSRTFTRGEVKSKQQQRTRVQSKEILRSCEYQERARGIMSAWKIVIVVAMVLVCCCCCSCCCCCCCCFVVAVVFLIFSVWIPQFGLSTVCKCDTQAVAVSSRRLGRDWGKVTTPMTCLTYTLPHQRLSST